MRRKLNIGLLCLGILTSCATYDKVYEVIDFQGTVQKKERIRLNSWPAPKEYRIIVTPNETTKYYSKEDTIIYDSKHTYQEVKSGSQVDVVRINTHKIRNVAGFEISREIMPAKYDIDPKYKTNHILRMESNNPELKETTGTVISKINTTDYSKYEESDDYTITIAMNLEGKVDTITHISKSLHKQVETNSIVEISYFNVYKNNNPKTNNVIDTKIYEIIPKKQ